MGEDETPEEIRAEIKAELDDAFQFVDRAGWVTREWAEALVARAVELGTVISAKGDT